MHHHVRQLSVSIVRTVESDICRCISPRGFRPIQRTITGLGGIDPAPGIGEGAKLRLAYLSARLAKEDVVIGVRIKLRIEINKINDRIGKFFPIRKPFQVVAKIQPIHSFVRRMITDSCRLHHIVTPLRATPRLRACYGAAGARNDKTITAWQPICRPSPMLQGDRRWER